MAEENDETKDLTADLAGDLTRELSDRELLEAVLARLLKVEAFIEDRSRDTNPMLECIYKEVADNSLHLRTMADELKTIRCDIGFLREDVLQERHARAILAERVTELEAAKRMQ